MDQKGNEQELLRFSLKATTVMLVIMCRNSMVTILRYFVTDIPEIRSMNSKE